MIGEIILMWDLATPVKAKTYTLANRWPYHDTYIESLTTKPGAGLLVNGHPWQLGIVISCKDILTYVIDKPFENPAKIRIVYSRGDECTKDEMKND